MEGMIGEIRMFAGNFAPKYWAFCQGQIISISSNTALFSILGTTYGGNGTTTFALPNFAGRIAVGAGQGPGLSSYQLGQVGGTETVTLNAATTAAHTHVAAGSYSPGGLNGQGDESNPNSGFPASSTGLSIGDIYNSMSNVTMGPTPVTVTVGPVGGSQPHENEQPSLGMNYVICQYGVYPQRQ